MLCLKKKRISANSERWRNKGCQDKKNNTQKFYQNGDNLRQEKELRRKRYQYRGKNKIRRF